MTLWWTGVLAVFNVLLALTAIILLLTLACSGG